MPDDANIENARCPPIVTNLARWRAGHALTGLCPLAIVGVFLAGCAFVPLPVQAVSYAIDGISYMTTNKSVLDHGISEATGRDCATFRIVTEGAACRDTMAVGPKSPRKPGETAIGLTSFSPPTGHRAP